MYRKAVLNMIIAVILLLVGIPFFMYGEDGYSFPQALLMVALIDMICYLPINWGVPESATETSVVKQIIIYTLMAALIILLLIFFDSKRSFGQSLCIALGITLFIYVSDAIINVSVRKMVKK